MLRLSHLRVLVVIPIGVALTSCSTSPASDVGSACLDKVAEAVTAQWQAEHSGEWPYGVVGATTTNSERAPESTIGERVLRVTGTARALTNKEGSEYQSVTWTCVARQSADGAPSAQITAVSLR